MARTRTKAADLPVPLSRDEAAAAIRAIGEDNRLLLRLTADMNDQLAATKQDFESKAAPVRAAIAAKTGGLRIWAEKNRQMLTSGGKTKTADLGTGKLSWRTRPPKVRLTKGLDIIAALKALHLTRFIRTSEEVDKEAMLREPAVARDVAGVSIGSGGEDFIVEPFEAELSKGEQQ